MASNKFTRVQLRRDSKENLRKNDPILRSGEPIVELETGRIKIGDGKRRWNELEYSNTIPKEIEELIDETARKLSEEIARAEEAEKANADAIDALESTHATDKATLEAADTALEKDIDLISTILAKEGYSDITVNSITLDGVKSTSKIVEIGATRVDTRIRWNVEGNLTKVTFVPKATLANIPVREDQTELVYSMDRDRIGRNTYDLVFEGTIGSTIKTLYIYVLNNFYYGVATALDNEDDYNADFLRKLKKSKPTTFYHDEWTTYSVPTVNAGDGEYIFIALPKSLIKKNILFNIGGFDDNWVDQYTISVTNDSGVTMDYVLFKSGQAALGSTTITMKNNQ